MLQMGSGEKKRPLLVVITDMLEFVKSCPLAELELVGLKHDAAGSVVIAENGRPLCVIEPEHFGCIQFGFTERRPGR
jgi:hypothetical protein